MRKACCGKRFGWQLGDLPAGYDHKYIFSNLGYNLKVTDMQAAIGLAQLEKIADFGAKRRANFRRLADGLARWSDRLICHSPSHKSAYGSWISGVRAVPGTTLQ